MRIAVIWSNFGPYHVARLDAAGKRLRSEDGELFGLEICTGNSVYAWNPVAGAHAFRRVTVHPGRDYQDITVRRVRSTTRQALDSLLPDVVGIPGWRAPEALSALAWCLEHRRGAVIMSESNEHDAARNACVEIAKQRIVGACDAALVGGQSHFRYLVRLGMEPGRIFTGYDAVDNAFFAGETVKVRQAGSSIREQEQLPRHFFLTCCRLVGVKNLFRLLDAYGIYRQRTADPWGLVICGDGVLSDQLRAYAGSKAIKGVTWAGFVQVDRLPRFYGLADAFVLASTVEPWGLVVNEAMASGLPVLVSDRCGSAELVEEGKNGFLFDPSSVDQLAQRLCEMSTGSHDLASMGEISRRRIEKYTPDVFAERLVTAARQAVETRAGRTATTMDRVLTWILQ